MATAVADFPFRRCPCCAYMKALWCTLRTAGGCLLGCAVSMTSLLPFSPGTRLTRWRLNVVTVGNAIEPEYIRGTSVNHSLALSPNPITFHWFLARVFHKGASADVGNTRN
ncbi:hypothetical protein, unlikely [Trypanosoma brucei gambiense DAL972]|uniref:Uncharacterized protein n=1 Tax=Trypanosoma brucei gambiense (strain MHOM/CI/86/DAL972) TaxID=679716 RepID=C9ZUE5_TRYB9|nr:hypothetical protein, unlikely [Trypanosoma brucei gambiense DAL972]CBH13032.1 hypothetical protein, unlikely [Trypanosoma brucei gambiense DAL972]|eukprot:XP_011775310.1 hypothetical protein, unlikely [Trypanosoma brucei gambiense DAL972]